MKHSLLFVTALAAAGLSGCASLSGPPLPPEIKLASCDAYQNPTSKSLCNTVAGDTSYADFNAKYKGINRERLALDSLIILSTAAAAGFGLFDAHPDNLRAATLGSGTFTVLRGNLNQNEKATIYRDAVSVRNCFRGNALSIISAYEMETNQGKTVAELRQDIQTVMSASNAILEGLNPSEAADADAVTLRGLIDTATSRLDDTKTVLLAMDRFPVQYNLSYATATQNIGDRLQSTNVNARSLAQLISEAIKAIQTEGDEMADGAEEEGPLSVSDEVDLKPYISRLESALGAYNRRLPEDIIAAYENLSVCVADSAS